jgi:hypothetical protein
MKGRFAPLTRCPGFDERCSNKIDETRDLCSYCRKRRQRAARGDARKGNRR